MAYLLEANRYLIDGFSMELIDKAAVDFGMPVGPIELANRVGLDICLLVR
ncbi:3-hydroxyacyl-CoA dehydrogenase family protein [Candidatus Coxiella mudrowiae]|nr:3-hydroxyacyl-CoA dehydrogenase family protein [Candidatus Coxiella mudrowiae]